MLKNVTVIFERKKKVDIFSLETGILKFNVRILCFFHISIHASLALAFTCNKVAQYFKMYILCFSHPARKANACTFIQNTFQDKILNTITMTLCTPWKHFLHKIHQIFGSVKQSLIQGQGGHSKTRLKPDTIILIAVKIW